MVDKLQEIREALAAATPGPWEATNLGDINITKGYRYENGLHVARWIADMCEDNQSRTADAHLIANAPSYISYLLETVEQLQRQVADQDNVIKASHKVGEELGREVVHWQNRYDRLVDAELRYVQEIEKLQYESNKLEKRIDDLRRENDQLHTQKGTLRQALEKTQYHLTREQYMSAEDVVDTVLSTIEGGTGK